VLPRQLCDFAFSFVWFLSDEPQTGERGVM
jgi:hypothetical protein